MSQTIKWDLIKERSKDYWAEFQGTTGGTSFAGPEDKVGTPIWNYYAMCKWDGCVELKSYSNAYSWNHECEKNCPCSVQEIHVCNLEEYIFEIGVLLEEARHFFRDKPGAEYWGKNSDE